MFWVSVGMSILFGIEILVRIRDAEHRRDAGRSIRIVFGLRVAVVVKFSV